MKNSKIIYTIIFIENYIYTEYGRYISFYLTNIFFCFYSLFVKCISFCFFLELLFSLKSTFTCAIAGNLSLPDLTEDIRRRESPLMYINGLSGRVGSFLMIIVDIRGLATLFSYFPRVSRGNRQQHCFSLALLPLSHSASLALSPSI